MAERRGRERAAGVTRRQAVLRLACGVLLLGQAGSSELGRVRAELQAWFAAQRAVGREAGAAEAAARHRVRFLRAWPQGAAGEAWLRDHDRLRAVFAGCFAYPAKDAKLDLPGVRIDVPPSYDPGRASPAVLEVWPRPGFGAHVSAESTIVVGVTPSRLQALVSRFRRLTTADVAASMLVRIAMTTPAAALAGRLWVIDDPVGDLYRGPGAVDDELAQRGLFYLLGVLQRQYNIDRDRLFVDAAASACRAVLRAAVAAPDRFAGIVLRAPQGALDLAIENLATVGVLVLRREQSAAAAAAVLRALQAIPEAHYEVRDLAATDGQQLAAWCGTCRRELLPTRVRLVMPADGIVEGYWVGDIDADVGGGDGDGPARIDVIAERRSNRIIVDAYRIERFSLLLNDVLVDLDRPLSLEVNGVKVEMRRSRSLTFLCEQLLDRFDPAFLFTTAVAIDVPRRG